MPYAIYTNIPECLPENGPHWVDSLEEAKQCAFGELEASYGVGESLDEVIPAVRSIYPSGDLIELPEGRNLHIEFKTWLEALSYTDVVLVGQYPSSTEKEIILARLNATG